MILRKVTLSHWRALTKWEMTLSDGLNVLQGRNEAGKSSIVEAIDWALYRDITGARLKAEEVRVLIPASDPTARPSVEVELEFADCRATLLKILAEDSGKRECRLTIRRDGKADEHFDRTEAQRRLRSLFAADGMGEEKGSSADGGLLVSHQGESSDFLRDGSTAIRSTLGVSSDGQLALTTRLERARALVEAQRRKELMQELEANAVASARAGTEAARSRESLREARNQKEHFEMVEREIEDLRGQIGEIEEQLRELRPNAAAARKRIEELGALQIAQSEADKAVLSFQGVEKEARGGLEAAKHRADEIARLRRAQDGANLELENSQSAVEAAEKVLEATRVECEAAHEASERAQQEAEDARHLADAWRLYFAVFEAQTALNDEKKALAHLELLGEELRTAQTARDGAATAPTSEELHRWRTAFDHLKSLETEATQSLQLEVRAQTALEMGWKADGGEAKPQPLGNGESATFSALAEGVLEIAGIGRFRVHSGARGVEELRLEIEGARQDLEKLLAPWSIELAALPGAFEAWENRRTARDQLERAWKEAIETLKREEARSGSLHDAQHRVAEREAEFTAAKVACKPFEGLIEFRGKKRPEVRTAYDAADSEARALSARSSRARNDAATAAQRLREAESKWHDVKARPDALRAAIAGREEELKRLQSDALTPHEREALLADWNQKLARARLDLESAQSLRRDMGDGVSNWRLEEARRSSAALSEQCDEQEKALVARRRDLFHACDQDAFGEKERLDALIETLETETARHEARLRGLVLLDAAIQAERARLSRDLAGPLNEKLAPWLSKLRGKDTHLGFDEAGSRIENVLTRSGDDTISLPFSEHSEGLKEQVAFALRLLLATRVASHLPSKRLPVILDDPFTQSDASRRGGLGEVLRDASQSLQILFVTCHGAPPVEGLDLNLIRLGDWDEETLVKRTVKAGKKVEKREKVVLPTNSVENGTLALF